MKKVSEWINDEQKKWVWRILRWSVIGLVTLIFKDVPALVYQTNAYLHEIDIRMTRIEDKQDEIIENRKVVEARTERHENRMDNIETRISDMNDRLIIIETRLHIKQ